MSRKLTGSVEWRTSKGKPPGWHARVTVRDKETGDVARPWVHLDAPHLLNTPEDKERAKKLGAKAARMVEDRGGEFVGERAAAAPRADATIAELETKWLELVDLNPKMKRATRHQHRSVMRAHVVPAFGTRAPSEITTPVLRAFFREKTATKAASTVRNIANSFTAFFADVKAEGWSKITANPMRAEEVREVLPTVEAPDPEDIVHLTPEHARKLLALEAIDDVDFGVYLLELTGGAREGEVYGARFSDMDIEDSVFRLRLTQQALMARGEGSTVQLGPLKSRGSRRALPIHPVFAAWLVGWALDGWRAHVGRDPKPGDLLFPDARGAVQRPRSADRLRAHLVAAGLPATFTTGRGDEVPFDAHALRHSFATMLDGFDVPGDIADRLLGHAPTTTRGRHYQAPKLATLERAVLALPFALPPRLDGSNRPGNRPDDVQTEDTAAGKSGGREGIRTLGTLRYGGFQSRSEGISGDLQSSEDQAEVRETPTLSGDLLAAPSGPTESSKTPRDDSPGTIPDHRDAVEDALAEALRGATLAGRWDLVAQLARELESRRQASAGNVVSMADRARRGGR